MSVVSAPFWHATGTLRAQLGEETLMPHDLEARRVAGCKDDPVNHWLRARNGWTLLLIIWRITLAGALLGTVTAMMVFPASPPTSFASHLRWVVGGSLFAALCGTGGALYRRRRQG
jgi:hypothetical protein